MEIDGHGRKGRKTDGNGMRMNKNGQEWMGRHGKGIGREWRKITIELSKLPQNHRERRTRFPGTKYFHPMRFYVSKVQHPRSNGVEMAAI
jgi:hypothetical protein